MAITAQERAQRRCVCATLRKATRSVTQFFDNTLRPSGLRSTQFHILAEVRGAGEATVTQLTKLLVIDQTTLTRSLALLERDGLLTTVPKPDGRLKSVRLTTKGDRALAAAFPLWSAAQAKMVSTIGLAAWEVIAGKLETLAQKAAA
jgi:DNA-binding MarR family transcriptional regulator